MAAAEVSQTSEEEGTDMQHITADYGPYSGAEEEEEGVCNKGPDTEQLEHSLIGYAVDGTASAELGFIEISKYVSNAWKQFQVPKVSELKDGVYLFEFATEEAMKSVLERNWAVLDQYPLVLQPWTPNLDINEFPPPSASEPVRVCEELVTTNYSIDNELGHPTKKVYSREEIEALRFANIIEQKKIVGSISTKVKAAGFSKDAVLENPTKRMYSIEEMEALRFANIIEQKKLVGIISTKVEAAGFSKDAVLENPTRRMYSIKEMEALRFVDVAEQKTVWRKMHSALEADVVQEYNSLTKSKRQRNTKLDSDSNSRQHSGRKGKASSVPGKENFGTMDSALEKPGSSADHSYHACTQDVGDEDNFACGEADFSEDDDSEEEFHSILKPAFFVEGKPDFDSGPPEDGLEYLRRVRWEAAQCPKVKVAKLEKNIIKREQSAYMPQIPEIARCPDHLLPSKQWEDAFLADFTELRQALSDQQDHITSISSSHQQVVFAKDAFFKVNESVSAGNSNNLESSSKSPIDDTSNDYPTMSAIQKLAPVARVSMLRKHITSFETITTLSKKDCAWLFALCAAVDTPLDADSCAYMRSLLRKCASLRAGKSELDDEVIMLNILATISGRYFGQSEI